MTFNPRDFLNIAQAVAAISPSEAALRTAVGVRITLCFWLPGTGSYRREGCLAPTSLPAAHTESSAITSPIIDTATGQQLDALRRLRIQADYVIDSGDPRYQTLYADWGQNWSAAQVIARNVLARLQSL